MDTVSEAVSGLDGKLDGVSNFLKETTSGGLGTMIGNFFSNSRKLLLVPYTKDFRRITRF